MKLSRKQPKTRKFGIEIEAFGVGREQLCQALFNAGIACTTAAYNHQDSETHWKITSDGSINGQNSFELVSPILEGKAGLVQIRTVCQVLEAVGAQVNKSCGLHVHHDARDLSLKAWKNLVKNYLKFEPVFDSLMPGSRRGNRNTFCGALAAHFPEGASLKAMFAQIRACQTLEALSRLLGATRYNKLNLEAFWRHGSVEIRHHSGTIEADKIIHWILLTQGLLESSVKAKTVTIRGAGQFQSLMNACKAGKTIERFYEERRHALLQRAA